MLTAPLYVVQTWFLEDDAGYGIELAPERTASHPASRLRFVTRDKDVYADALAAEGYDVRVVARWHQAYTTRVLDELAPA